jgi:asparagine synthase (glutamine-hydrolysing)
MCGVNGFNWKDGTLIEDMNRVTKHRGPDDEGVYIDNMVSLGHVRLSIIDLSEKGHQPMSNEYETVWLTYNGEVYNFQELREDLLKKGHKFRSSTDAEVVIHAYEEYGLDCVKQFNGMWAFCIYDKNKDILILSRDRFGIKPLYYYIDEDKIIFSSMIAGILCHDIETAPNDKAIMEYLAFNLEDHKEYTFFKNIYSLAQGSILIYNLKTKQHNIQQWYYPEFRDIKNEDNLREIFTESVRLRTVSDVPVGSCLSGGIDSSAIVCTLDKFLKDTFSTYSLVVPGNPIDESKYIKEVGRNTDTKQFFTTVNEDDFLKEFNDFIVAQEEPVTGLSPYAQYRVMKLAHEQNAKVLLDGQGGDEIFAGYIYYFSWYFYELFTKFKWYHLIKETGLYLKNFKNAFPHAMFIFLLLPEAIKYFTWKRFMNKWVNHKLLEKVCDDEKDPRWKAMNLKDGLSLTLFSTAIPHLLRWEDKNSMRWSIESRVPLLDVMLVEAASSLPSEQKLHNGRTKIMFRKAMNDILPEMIKNRTDKIGFGTPVDDFFRNEKIVAFSKEIIYSESFKRRPYWKWDKVEKMLIEHIENKKNIGDTIWKWINLEMWLREFFDVENGIFK